jgi:hypothetical protein
MRSMPHCSTSVILNDNVPSQSHFLDSPTATLRTPRASNRAGSARPSNELVLSKNYSKHKGGSYLVIRGKKRSCASVKERRPEVLGAAEICVLVECAAVSLAACVPCPPKLVLQVPLAHIRLFRGGCPQTPNYSYQPDAVLNSCTLLTRYTDV